jgi:hypothetical protein
MTVFKGCSKNSIEPHDIGTCMLRRPNAGQFFGEPHCTNLVWTNLAPLVSMVQNLVMELLSLVALVPEQY